jgi:hypothetical protein
MILKARCYCYFLNEGQRAGAKLGIKDADDVQLLLYCLLDPAVDQMRAIVSLL